MSSPGAAPGLAAPTLAPKMTHLTLGRCSPLESAAMGHGVGLEEKSICFPRGTSWRHQSSHGKSLHPTAGSQSSTPHQAGDPGLSPPPATGAPARPSHSPLTLNRQLATWPFRKPGAGSEVAQDYTWGEPAWVPEHVATLLRPILLFTPRRLLHGVAVSNELIKHCGLYKWDTLTAPSPFTQAKAKHILSPQVSLTPHVCPNHAQLGN